MRNLIAVALIAFALGYAGGAVTWRHSPHNEQRRDIASIIGEINWRNPKSSDELTVRIKEFGRGYSGWIIKNGEKEGFPTIEIQHSGSIDAAYRPHGSWDSFVWKTSATHRSWWWHGRRVTNVNWHRNNGDDSAIPLLTETWLEIDEPTGR